MIDTDNLIPIALFICCVWIIDRVIDRRALNKERLKMIEKGANVKDLNLNTEKPPKYTTLKYGLVAIGLSLGILSGAILTKIFILPDEVSYPFSIFLFVGLMLVLSHYIVRKEVIKEKI